MRNGLTSNMILLSGVWSDRGFLNILYLTNISILLLPSKARMKVLVEIISTCWSFIVGLFLLTLLIAILVVNIIIVYGCTQTCSFIIGIIIIMYKCVDVLTSNMKCPFIPVLLHIITIN